MAHSAGVHVAWVPDLRGGLGSVAVMGAWVGGELEKQERGWF